MKSITDFFKSCPAFQCYKVMEDYLGPQSGSVAIAPDGREKTVKIYASGDRLEQISFKIMVRENYIGKASETLERTADWILVSGQLPHMENAEPQFIEVTENPRLIKSDVNSGVYEMKLRLVYYKKGE